ncbi:MULTISPECIES: NAD(P)H-dependent glycerol-3-phosphate dehydrogenase [unclassified Variovorax]|uniref:NAD(P)H-dependent glycerol-3-phosphate dehydrogenase n=1 Tax=unclassified Variovorax TaxID=663243 RepID=UPI00076CC60A|nr:MULTISPECIES: NAD(P)H-dependent glycerol-3-phosphate dehydrogenase [unclassified Variovorax]KWT83825.1 Glycerol-3-phosphate dehydrogenase [NAD(P)+] [Variovorax sp. WDL1]PNG46503.1 Glycerol-3-phosphate dehydrogenase [NAD(P)+] [Variovorax sp. B2]PNG47675.1 Glycerol-3-phosphate dehydrogenase [NAD(P)+] [Variovorax sp. B4]VTV14258.1 Glycerol-3-phosphate dehydrogenase [NAD(P)+] [Variovorax sp. WDL1]
MKICVLGAGAWGTALAVNAAGRHAVSLWARDAAQVQAMMAARENARYLPGIPLPPSLALRSGTVPAAVADADLAIIATPMAALREQLLLLRDAACPVAWLCKGVEPALAGADGLLAHEIQAQVAPGLVAGVLSGPSFAQEVAQGRPTALVAASAHPGLREALVGAFHGPSLRVYANEDIVGVEVGGAVKNVLAIATGLADGLALGLNARAALITRGLAEMTRLGVALGARPDTFMGLSGLGDLVLTATGDLSRNRKVGLLLAQGQTLAQAVDSLGHVAEGVYCARTVVQRARHLGVEMPIAESVVALLDGRVRPAEAVTELMSREPGVEAP